MTLNGIMAVTLRHFTEFGKKTCVPTHNGVDLWRNLWTSLLYFVVRVRCRRKEVHVLLMSFLFIRNKQICYRNFNVHYCCKLIANIFIKCWSTFLHFFQRRRHRLHVDASYFFDDDARDSTSTTSRCFSTTSYTKWVALLIVFASKFS